MVALSVVRRGRAFALPDASLRIAARALDAAGGGWRLLAGLARHRAGSALLDAIERVALPDLAAHHCRRKQWLLQRLRTLVPGTRLLWPAVGFDGTGVALRATIHDLQLHEFDHPDSLRLRECIVGDTPGVARSALRLPDDGGVLLDLCAASTAPCVIVVEGLAMYLPARPLLRLLRALAALPSPPGLLFTALAPTHRNGTGFAAENGIVRRWLSRQREPFLWRCPQARLLGLLRRLGYRIDADWDGTGYGEYAIDAVPRAARFVMPAA
ncbi:hypothetical protein GCM10023307_23250 [Lysobacter hankyongensis]|uniref:Class I SAM-dependent methyltransferase n=2 Tax=Lysobacter hankyongensis TaxID=1176535 RepID=A0ABP9BJV8_9GAMM